MFSESPFVGDIRARSYLFECSRILEFAMDALMSSRGGISTVATSRLERGAFLILRAFLMRTGQVRRVRTPMRIFLDGR